MGVLVGYWSKLLIFFSLEETSCIIPSIYVLCNAKRTGRLCSVDLMEGASRKIALSPVSELALLSDISKLDSTGKFILLPEY